jgi:hypothetical protein
MNEGNDGIVIRTMHVNVKVHILDVCGIDVFQFIPMQEEFEDTKGVIRIRILKKNRQHNGQKEKYKRSSYMFMYIFSWNCAKVHVYAYIFYKVDIYVFIVKKFLQMELIV